MLITWVYLFSMLGDGWNKPFCKHRAPIHAEMRTQEHILERLWAPPSVRSGGSKKPTSEPFLKPYLKTSCCKAEETLYMSMRLWNTDIFHVKLQSHLNSSDCKVISTDAETQALSKQWPFLPETNLLANTELQSCNKENICCSKKKNISVLRSAIGNNSFIFKGEYMLIHTRKYG